MGLQFLCFTVFILFSQWSEASVIDLRRVWAPGQSLNVLFLDGKERWQERVRDVAPEISRYANLHLKFFDRPIKNETYHIRISFYNDGNASVVGTDGLKVSQDKPTMWLPVLSKRRSSSKSKDGTILHEFLHAIGYRHEHQNKYFPYTWRSQFIEKSCIRPMMKSRKKSYSRAQATKRCNDDYMRLGANFEHSFFDEESIMMYSVGTGSLKENRRKTYSEHNELSDQDKRSLTNTFSWGRSLSVHSLEDTSHLPIVVVED